MKKLIVLLACIYTSHYTNAQNIITNILSPSESRYYDTSIDIDMKMKEELFSNPAFHNIKNTGISFISLAQFTLSRGKSIGDYLPYQGNNFSDYRFATQGIYSPIAGAKLYGNLQYSGGEHKNIAWNAVRHPHLYLPYISTDSIGGNIIFKEYTALGGYSFKIKNWNLGIETSFTGEQAHRNTDPRILNNTSWVSIKLGLARQINKHLFMLEALYRKNKQYMSIRYWRPGQQDRFFVSYGLGLYDVKRSLVSFGYSRMHYINDYNTALTYKSPLKKKLEIYARINYKYANMKTEERDIKNLFSYNDNTIKTSIIGYIKQSSKLKFALSIFNNIQVRQGYENIFEQYLVDKTNSVYDFKLIDKQKNYKLLKHKTTIQLKAYMNISEKEKINISLGTTHKYRAEQYKTNKHEIINSSNSPHIGISYLRTNQSTSINISSTFTHKEAINNSYNINLDKKTIEFLDFQHAFAPYAYLNSNFNSLRINTSLSKHLDKFSVGINFRLLYTKGNRDKNTNYTREIGFKNGAKSINKLADKHDEKWSSISLFVNF